MEDVVRLATDWKCFAMQICESAGETGWTKERMEDKVKNNLRIQESSLCSVERCSFMNIGFDGDVEVIRLSLFQYALEGEEVLTLERIKKTYQQFKNDSLHGVIKVFFQILKYEITLWLVWRLFHKPSLLIRWFHLNWVHYPRSMLMRCNSENFAARPLHLINIYLC